MPEQILKATFRLQASFLSDAVLELFYGWGFHANMLEIYASFAVIVCLGFYLRDNKKPLPILGAALVASSVFYFTTNLAVWSSSQLYPKTADGLIACYVAGIPFFGNTIAGDLFYTGFLFGVFAVAKHRFPILKLQRPREI